MTPPPDFEVNGLRIELATRRMRGPLVPGGRPRRWLGRLTGLPAVVLTVALLVLPAAWTVVIATRARPAEVLACAIVAVSALLPAVLRRRAAPPRIRIPLWLTAIGGTAGGLWLLAGTMSPDGKGAYLRTLLWVAFAVGLLLLALAIAWWGRAARWLWLPLIVPFGVSAFVSGVAFRVIFGSGARWLDIEDAGIYRWWLAAMLGSAFLWTWLGFLTALFRAGIHAIEADPARAGYLYRDDGRPLALRLYELLRPVLLIAGLAVGVAAARVFDVVLIGVPGALEYQVDSATVHWWRLSADTEPGAAAAYALPLAVLVGAVAWLLQVDVRRHRASWSAVRAMTVPGRRRIGAVRAAGIGLVSVLVLFPIGVLAYTGVRGHDGFGFSAVALVWGDDGLWRSLQTTAWVAGIVTVVVVTAAAPVAYRLAALRPDGTAARVAVVALVVLAVIPAQTYLGPIDGLVDTYELSGTRIPLILVHAAAGLPIAILVLRGAMLAPPGSGAADALHGLASPGTIARRLLASSGPALGAVAVLEFVQVWNDFFIGLVVSGAGASPWSLLLWGEARQFGENAAQVAAGSLVSAVLPVALLLATWRRWVVPGLTGGVLR
ncbi:carbohydrate ABC transporter permease [Nocardia abscessus]|uniref:carbohydrate ABC transporter permease n=1 Tax=Nocardia abscessus TaxID=120957 RepID=UPI0018935C84|nr:carbohydrate ABC transporter permease [Nocardia abscessus]MBF6338628.1 carbohydrate ABC transporter permease [Nocardia abscessus]